MDAPEGRRRLGSLAVALLAAAAPLAVQCQTPEPRWEIELGGGVGFPIGHLRVGEFPTGALAGRGGSPGTRLRFHDLGIDVSETVQAGVGFHVTPDDTIRASFLYSFLERP